MGLLNRAVGIIACCALVQVCPVTAQARQAEVDEGEEVSQRPNRKVRRIANALFFSGLAFSALERGHRREVCVEGACAMERRRGYSWAAIAGYAGASVGYFWIVGTATTACPSAWATAGCPRAFPGDSNGRGRS